MTLQDIIYLMVDYEADCSTPAVLTLRGLKRVVGQVVHDLGLSSPPQDSSKGVLVDFLEPLLEPVELKLHKGSRVTQARRGRQRVENWLTCLARVRALLGLGVAADLNRRSVAAALHALDQPQRDEVIALVAKFNPRRFSTAMRCQEQIWMLDWMKLGDVAEAEFKAPELEVHQRITAKPGVATAASDGAAPAQSPASAAPPGRPARRRYVIKLVFPSEAALASSRATRQKKKKASPVAVSTDDSKMSPIASSSTSAIRRSARVRNQPGQPAGASKDARNGPKKATKKKKPSSSPKAPPAKKKPSRSPKALPAKKKPSRSPKALPAKKKPSSSPKKKKPASPINAPASSPEASITSRDDGDGGRPHSVTVTLGATDVSSTMKFGGATHQLVARADKPRYRKVYKFPETVKWSVSRGDGQKAKGFLEYVRNHLFAEAEKQRNDEMRTDDPAELRRRFLTVFDHASDDHRGCNPATCTEETRRTSRRPAASDALKLELEVIKAAFSAVFPTEDTVIQLLHAVETANVESLHRAMLRRVPKTIGFLASHVPRVHVSRLKWNASRPSLQMQHARNQQRKRVRLGNQAKERNALDRQGHYKAQQAIIDVVLAQRSAEGGEAEAQGRADEAISKHLTWVYGPEPGRQQQSREEGGAAVPPKVRPNQQAADVPVAAVPIVIPPPAAPAASADEKEAAASLLMLPRVQADASAPSPPPPPPPRPQPPSSARPEAGHHATHRRLRPRQRGRCCCMLLLPSTPVTRPPHSTTGARSL
jgi:hypothetical protein